MMKKTKYTREQVMFIMENYTANPDKCVEVIRHSLGSIKALLKNIAHNYGAVNFSGGNPMYTEVANEYRVKKNMSINKWIALYL